jgi:hypothetical protein
MAKFFEPTPEMKALLVQAGSNVEAESRAANQELAVAVQTPLREGILNGDITDGIFETFNIPAGPSSSVEWPLDLLSPGTEKDFVAYTIPNHGRIAEKHVEGDYVMIPTYEIGSSIDMLLKYAKNARWDVAGRAMEVLQGSFVKKINDDSWHTLLSAGVDRNILVFDADANAGQFTKRLVSLMKTVMRRNGGGNSTSQNRSKLTDLYLSPEAMEDIRNWGIDQIDEQTRREIWLAEDGSVNRIWGVNLHDLDEFGEGQEYQLFYSNELLGGLPSGDVEIVVGLDRSKRDSFVMPITMPLEIFDDSASLHRQRRMGWYGWTGFGLGVLDGRRVILGSI